MIYYIDLPSPVFDKTEVSQSPPKLWLSFDLTHRYPVVTASTHITDWFVGVKDCSKKNQQTEMTKLCVLSSDTFTLTVATY